MNGLPHGVIGSTIDFGSISLGSSPNEVNIAGVVKWQTR